MTSEKMTAREYSGPNACTNGQKNHIAASASSSFPCLSNNERVAVTPHYDRQT
jgi:hypothetical protein